MSINVLGWLVLALRYWSSFGYFTWWPYQLDVWAIPLGIILIVVGALFELTTDLEGNQGIYSRWVFSPKEMVLRLLRLAIIMSCLWVFLEHRHWLLEPKGLRCGVLFVVAVIFFRLEWCLHKAWLMPDQPAAKESAQPLPRQEKTVVSLYCHKCRQYTGHHRKETGPHCSQCGAVPT